MTVVLEITREVIGSNKMLILKPLVSLKIYIIKKDGFHATHIKVPTGLFLMFIIIQLVMISAGKPVGNHNLV